MLGLGSNITKAGKIGKPIVKDGLVLKHGYAGGPVQPVSAGAVFVDGTDDYINTGSAFQSTFRDSFSICTWVKPVDGQESEVTILGTLSTNGEDGVRIDILTGGEVRFVFEGNNDESYRTTSSAVFSDGVNDWTHIACTATKVGSGSDATTLVIYINGVAVATTLVAATTAANHALYTSDINLTLGCRLYGTTPGRFFDGYMCNTGIWSAALTQAQVKSIMHKDYASLSDSEKTSLVSWWNLDSVIDSVGASTAVYDNHYAGGSELGAEMIDNGSFDENDTGWDVDSSGAGTTKTWVNSFGGREGVLHVSVQGTDSTNNRLKQSIDYVSGAWYKVQADIYVVSGVVRIDGKDEDMLGGTGGDVITTSGTGSWVTYTAYGYTPTTTSSNTDSLFIRALASSTAEFYIDNISVKLVNGNTGTLA